MKPVMRKIIVYAIALVVAVLVFIVLFWIGVKCLKYNEGIGIMIMLTSMILGPLVGAGVAVNIEEKLR